MFQVDPNTLYAVSELEAQLSDIVHLRTFMDRLGLRSTRLFRDAIWGWEILEAAKKIAQAISERDGAIVPDDIAVLLSRAPEQSQNVEAKSTRLSIDDL